MKTEKTPMTGESVEVKALVKCPKCDGVGMQSEREAFPGKPWACSMCVGAGKIKDRRRAPTDSALREAAEKFVKQIDMIHEHPQYKAVWDSHYVHGGQYKGPQYKVELDALRAALSSTATPGGMTGEQT